MERRDFIKNTGSILATTALVGLPSIVNANNKTQDVPDVTATFVSGASSPKIENFESYSIALYPSAIDNFKESDMEKRFMDFKGINNYEPTLFRFLIKKVKKIRGKSTSYKVDARYVSREEGDAKIPQLFKKKILFDIDLADPFENSKLIIKKDKRNALSVLNYKKPTTSGSGESCYITTACVTAKNLPDNCHELETLRGFRDNYIAKTTEGKAWIKTYYNNAPNLVDKINEHKNSTEIYEYIYENLVTKSVELVENKEYDTAFHFYKNCVINLDKII